MSIRPEPAVNQHGEGGTPIFFIHGMGVDHRILLPLDSMAAEAGLGARLFIDLPGMGLTEPLAAPGGLEQYADWLEAVLREYSGGQPFALLGHSLGGLLAQEMTERFAHQVCGLALMAPVVYPDQQRRTLPPRTVLREDPAVFAAAPQDHVEQYLSTAVIHSAQNFQRFTDYVYPGLRAANLRALARLSKGYFLNPLPVLLPGTVEVPTLILCGAQDHVTGFEDPKLLLRRYPDAEYRTIEAAGHNVHLDQPLAVRRALAAWGRRVAQGTGR